MPYRHRLPSVHVEHLPAGRYGAVPSTREDVIDPGSIDGSEGHPGIIHDVHHASKVYQSVSEGLYGTENYSIALCCLFALLALVQLGIAANILFRYAPALARMLGPVAGNWTRSKAQWISALVPASVARCCALLLLIADLRAKVRRGGGQEDEIRSRKG